MIKIEFSKKLHTAQGILNLEVDINVEEKSFVTLTGSSGAGKTTFLRILSGLVNPDTGNISISGEKWFSSEYKINLPPQKRRIGFVFQDYALFPNMTVLKNLTYVNKDADKMKNLLDIMGLTELSGRYPDKLSGGQKQRVALARAIAREPDILLLDEPLSAIDPEMRHKLQDEIAKIYKLFPVTVFLVSHDIPEIFKLSQRVIVIDNGKVVKDDSPENVFAANITSNKFSVTGEIIKIIKADILYIAYVSIGSRIIEVVITNEDCKNLKIGDRVLVGSKAFNPILQKIGSKIF